MADDQMVRKIDSISDVPYRIGYSFRNPDLVKPVTRTNLRPYFSMDWSGSVAQKKDDLYKSGVLQRFPTTWRRAAKAMAVQGLGVVGNRKELPSFNELGEAPGPTDAATTTSSTSRDIFGFLDNTIKTIGGVMAQGQQVEIARAQAVAGQRYQLPQFFTPGAAGGMGTGSWLLVGVGVVALGGLLYMRSKA